MSALEMEYISNQNTKELYENSQNAMFMISQKKKFWSRIWEKLLLKKEQPVPNIRGRLVWHFKQHFLVFKQHYTYFHTLFHPHVFPKNTNIITRTTLPNGPLVAATTIPLTAYPSYNQ